ncbi:MAG: hypothetical protein QXQ53_03865 [Candidatus Methanosuratincola sp.]
MRLGALILGLAVTASAANLAGLHLYIVPAQSWLEFKGIGIIPALMFGSDHVHFILPLRMTLGYPEPEQPPPEETIPPEEPVPPTPPEVSPAPPGTGASYPWPTQIEISTVLRLTFDLYTYTLPDSTTMLGLAAGPTLNMGILVNTSAGNLTFKNTIGGTVYAYTLWPSWFAFVGVEFVVSYGFIPTLSMGVRW